MGWGSGSNLMIDVIDIARVYIKDSMTRRAFFRDMIEAFESQDCDTLDECRGIDDEFDVALDHVQQRDE